LDCRGRLLGFRNLGFRQPHAGIGLGDGLHLHFVVHLEQYVALLDDLSFGHRHVDHFAGLKRGQRHESAGNGFLIDGAETNDAGRAAEAALGRHFAVVDRRGIRGVGLQNVAGPDQAAGEQCDAGEPGQAHPGARRRDHRRRRNHEPGAGQRFG